MSCCQMGANSLKQTCRIHKITCHPYLLTLPDSFFHRKDRKIPYVMDLHVINILSSRTSRSIKYINCQVYEQRGYFMNAIPLESENNLGGICEKWMK